MSCLRFLFENKIKNNKVNFFLPATNERHLETEFVKYHLDQILIRLLWLELVYLSQGHTKNEHEQITKEKEKISKFFF